MDDYREILKLYYIFKFVFTRARMNKLVGLVANNGGGGSKVKLMGPLERDFIEIFVRAKWPVFKNAFYFD